MKDSKVNINSHENIKLNRKEEHKAVSKVVNQTVNTQHSTLPSKMSNFSYTQSTKRALMPLPSQTVEEVDDAMSISDDGALKAKCISGVRGVRKTMATLGTSYVMGTEVLKEPKIINKRNEKEELKNNFEPEIPYETEEVKKIYDFNTEKKKQSSRVSIQMKDYSGLLLTPDNRKSKLSHHSRRSFN